MYVCHVTLNFVTFCFIANTKLSNSDNFPIKDVVKPCWSHITSLVATWDFRMAFLIRKQSKIRKPNSPCNDMSFKICHTAATLTRGCVNRFSCFQNHQVAGISKSITGAFYPGGRITPVYPTLAPSSGLAELPVLAFVFGCKVWLILFVFQLWNHARNVW